MSSDSSFEAVKSCTLDVKEKQVQNSEKYTFEVSWSTTHKIESSEFVLEVRLSSLNILFGSEAKVC